MRSLTVLYDPTCELCIRCRAFMERQRSYVPLEFVPWSSEEARRRFGSVPWLGAELCVVASDGRTWVGPAAFVICLWALIEYREWAGRLSTPELAPLAERFFRLLSAERQRIGALFSHDPCGSGSCVVQARGPYR